jgi:hypothetical protein
VKGYFWRPDAQLVTEAWTSDETGGWVTETHAPEHRAGAWASSWLVGPSGAATTGSSHRVSPQPAREDGIG